MVDLMDHDHYFTACLGDNDPLRKIPKNAVKEQVARARQGAQIRFGRKTYPAIYHNDQNLFPMQPEGFYWELPLSTQSIFLSRLTRPGPLRAIYNPQSGILYGVVAHRTIADRCIQPSFLYEPRKPWAWLETYKNWGYYDRNGDLILFSPHIQS